MATLKFGKDKARIVGVDIQNKNPVQRISEIPRRLLVLGSAVEGYLGQKDVVIKIEREEDIVQFGAGSQLSQMLKDIYAEDNYFELYACAISPDGEATEATADLIISGQPINNGVLTLYIAGIKVPVVFTKGMTQENMYDAIIREITANPDVPVKGAKTEGNSKVTLTSKWKGDTANNITVVANITNTELINMSQGVSITVNNLSGGTGTVKLNTFLEKWSDDTFTCIATAFTDTGNIDLLMNRATALFNFKECRGFYVIGGFNSDETTYVNYVKERNDKYYCAFWVENSPTPTYMIASNVAKELENQFGVSVATQIDGAIPNIIQGVSAYRGYDAKNKIVLEGGCTVKFNEFGQVLFENTNTTYKKAEDGSIDDAFFFLQTLGKLQVVQYETKQAFEKAPYYKAVLIDDNAVVSPNVNAVRPLTAKSTLSSLITSWEERALLNDAGVSRDSINAWIDEDISGLLNINFILFFTSPLGKVMVNVDWTLQLNS